MRYLLSVSLFASLMFAAGAANAQITLGPGQSQTITCSSAGGGGGPGTADCVSQLQSFCDSHTSIGGDACFTAVSQYCPSTAYVTCTQQTYNYCYSHTSLGEDGCFRSALHTCQGNHLAIRELMDNAVHQARIQERAVHAQSDKSK